MSWLQSKKLLIIMLIVAVVVKIFRQHEACPHSAHRRKTSRGAISSITPVSCLGSRWGWCPSQDTHGMFCGVSLDLLLPRHFTTELTFNSREIARYRCGPYDRAAAANSPLISNVCRGTRMHCAHFPVASRQGIRGCVAQSRDRKWESLNRTYTINTMLVQKNPTTSS